MHTLANEKLRVVIDPQHGASIMAFDIRLDHEWLPLMPDARRADVDLDCANFLMIPYSNRIENGCFSFAGQHFWLANSESHAIHGDVRYRLWQVLDSSAQHISCVFDSLVFSDINWPWSFAAKVDFRMVGNSLLSKLTVKNSSDSAMPLGLGWHPYFSRSLTREGEPVLIKARVKGVYPDANDNRIPSGSPVSLPDELDFSSGKELAPDRFFDHCLSGFSGNSSITWPESGVKVTFECSTEYTHLVLYNPLEKPYFAFEPVTNANNGFNLYEKGEISSGVLVLEPGESIDVSMNLLIDQTPNLK